MDIISLIPTIPKFMYEINSKKEEVRSYCNKVKVHGVFYPNHKLKDDLGFCSLGNCGG
jgi:hypothetical protein